MSLALKPKPVWPSLARAEAESARAVAARAQSTQRRLPIVLRRMSFISSPLRLVPSAHAAGLSQSGLTPGRAAASRSAGEEVREKRAAQELLEGASELRARTDLELAKDVAEVRLDGVLGEEERLCDLAVGHSLGGHASDAQLGGGEMAAALGGISAGAGAGCDELIVGAHSNRVGTAGTGQLERLAEWLARVRAPA